MSLSAAEGGGGGGGGKLACCVEEFGAGEPFVAPTPSMAFNPAAGSTIGCVGGGGTFMAGAARAVPGVTPNIAFKLDAGLGVIPNMAFSSVAFEEGVGAEAGGGAFALFFPLTKFFHLLMPFFPFLDLKPVPFSGGPLASRHPACLSLPVDSARGLPEDAARF